MRFGELAEAVAAQEAATQTDDLTRIKGLGPKLKARLAELGVVSFAQIAAWTEADIVAIDAQLGTFAGRSTRDQWVAQAQFLAAGDVAGYEAKFGKL
jgi:predicted flap endonuclease-1-like 5' DNA nuclease